MKNILSIFLFCPVVLFAQPVKERNLFQKEYERCNYSQSLQSLDQWIPYPRFSDRSFWNSIPEQKKKNFITAATAELGKDWVFLPAVRYLDFAVDGNRSRFESLVWMRQERLYAQIMAELIENNGRYMEDIANGIWSFCEESSWCWPAHIGMQKAGCNLPDVTDPTADLGVGVKSTALAWASYLLKDKLDSISPLIRKRIKLEVEKRLLIPVHERTDFGWMGYTSKHPNNWNPWIVSNYITCVLLLEEDRTRQASYIKKAVELLDLFVNGYYDDGGCDEGPSYWSHAGGCLFDCMDLLTMSSGRKFNLYNETVIRNIGSYIVSMHIDKKYYVNFADASPMNDYGKYKSLIYSFGKETGNEAMMKFGMSLVDETTYEKADKRFALGIRSLRDMAFEMKNPSNDAVCPYFSFAWFPGIQVMTARDKEGSSEGLFLAAQGGNNAESHNHNDVGNFIVYENGNPLIIDAGVETYTRKTFSDQRYTIWTMQSQYHNCPIINGVSQSPGPDFKATNVSCTNTDSLVTFSADISKAYPDSAFVESWQRSLRLHRGKSIEIADQYKLSKAVKPAQWIFLSYPEPTVLKPGVIAFKGSSRVLEFSDKLFTAKIELVEIKDPKMLDDWNRNLYRILLIRKAKSKAETCSFVIR